MKIKKLSNRNASIISVLIVGCIIFYYIRSWGFAGVYTFFILLAFLWNAFGALVERVWMSISKVLSFVMPKVMMSIIFFLILTPIALLSRLLKKEDPLHKKNKTQSLWKEDLVNYPPESFEKMW